MRQQFVIGIDGGGTRCRALLQDIDGNELGRAEAGPANIMSNAQQAMASIVTACKSVIAQTSLPISLKDVSVCAGVAGANVPEAKSHFLTLDHPFAEFTVISDAHAACLGAHGGSEGALIICGTGSSGTAYFDGAFTDKGGYGFNIGDQASAAWLGQKSVQHALLAFDDVQKRSELSSHLIDFLEVATPLQLVQAVSTYTPDAFGKLAPIAVQAMENGCDISHGLIAEGATYLTSLTKSLLASTNTMLPLCIVGGMAPVYLPFIEQHLKEQLVSPKFNAQQGAIFFSNDERQLLCSASQ